jgi:hypothetical protein
MKPTLSNKVYFISPKIRRTCVQDHEADVLAVDARLHQDVATRRFPRLQMWQAA